MTAEQVAVLPPEQRRKFEQLLAQRAKPKAAPKLRSRTDGWEGGPRRVCSRNCERIIITFIITYIPLVRTAVAREGATKDEILFPWDTGTDTRNSGAPSFKRGSRP